MPIRDFQVQPYSHWPKPSANLEDEESRVFPLTAKCSASASSLGRIQQSHNSATNSVNPNDSFTVWHYCTSPHCLSHIAGSSYCRPSRYVPDDVALSHRSALSATTAL
jgi:hypothetical protein